VDQNGLKLAFLRLVITPSSYVQISEYFLGTPPVTCNYKKNGLPGELHSVGSPTIFRVLEDS
jgi:hypothetical protein